MRIPALICAWLTALAVPFMTAPARAHAVPDGYLDPPFGATCEIHRFGEGEWPPLELWTRNPLCVEYSKRDITADNGGALRFLLAEPSRFAIAIPSCRYWQQDHWSVQTTTGAVAIVSWDGSYWFDKRDRIAAARLTNFRINGTTVGIGDVVLALRADFPELAAALSVYGTEHGETGLAAALPYSLWCGSR
ncbi:hypothetical protein [Kribbella deserti]|uniref:Uncharacterized protein n=1 Tax=Kribbella deserti TaxID=1926257 RepID=A0ABV6QN09_9ACTN